ncbi:tripartite tricarboxylate transporter permease [Jeotgalibaca ciconiae]|uniref:Tripartite tricarboxylate transporter TctA family protein n=1 Tax=Jeotgalibaca ciconiae TaxID=2496265 RepID=A0A3S9H7R9_9LACT|nr:tripartite tricarboxylate transporter permease [Jeotgalibaca ciconiae]AZP03386.1 tripartite tricarboxylate transporter TctA family protein [Jeotgalibaca ciconiae]
MDFSMIGQMIIAAVGATVLYTIIGFIPGTDETAVLMPITLAIVMAGIQPIVVLTFFISAIVALNLMNAMPTLVVGLPGGVLSTPMIEHSMMLKKAGLTHENIKKAAVGSLIGVSVSVPISLLFANLIAPYAEVIKSYASWLFVIGAIFLSLMGRAKLLSLVMIVPVALLFQSLRTLYWDLNIVPFDKNITTSFFLGITVGPLLVSLLSFLIKDKRVATETTQLKETIIPVINRENITLNPFKIIKKEESIRAGLSSFLSTFLFVLSPVGIIILFGELAAKQAKNPIEKASTSIVTMSALAQSTYLSGIIICVVALGIPLSPAAIGPGGALFTAPPVFTMENNIHHALRASEFTLAIVFGALIAISMVYFLAIRYATNITSFVLTKIPHEAILGLFIALVLLLSFMDAGLLNVFGVLLIGFICGSLNNLGINYGIQFMTLYAAPFIVSWFAQ